MECIVHRLDLGLYSHPKKILENGVRTHVNSKGKIPSTGGLKEAENQSTHTFLHLVAAKWKQKSLNFIQTNLSSSFILPKVNQSSK